jgi:hypothetical protein
MGSPAYDLGYLKAGVEVCKTYIKSQHLFFPLNTPSPYGEPAYHRLTLGGLLLAVARLEAQELPDQQALEFRTLQRWLTDFRAARRVAWERKAQRELLSRLRQWQIYSSELLADPEQHLSFYTNEVKIRVMIELLIQEVGPLEKETLNMLETSDGLLRMIFHAGEFIWEDVLAPGFPPNPYWYLWGNPSIERENGW